MEILPVASSKTRKTYDIVALSAAAVDISILADDALIDNHGLKKGLTNNVTAETLASILRDNSDATRTPGSPGVNVVAGIALRGGSAALIGKIANDEHGNFFAQRLQSHGVGYTPLLHDEKAAATTCIAVITTPDKERTFAFAGSAGQSLSPEDVDRQLLDKAKIVYLDSYLWLSQSGKDAVHHAADEAKKTGGKVALALNDAHVVGNSREGFLALAASHADILLGDKNEFMTLFGTKTLEDTIEAVKKLGCTAAITAGAEGAYVVENGASTHIPVKKVEKIVDTNGAGDQFAAGFLYGLVQGKSAEQSGHIGSQWAADVIQHRGPEPQVGKNKPSSGFICVYKRAA
jgi:sugar/nucleoside kinase (ribokinase family)